MKFTFFKKKAANYKREKSATKRANELGCRIKAAIDAGQFKLSSGYLLRFVNKQGENCEGCAVAAAAFACGLKPTQSMSCWDSSDRKVFHAEQQECQIQVQETGLMTAAEAAQLEMGYENWGECDTWGPGEDGNDVIKVNRRSPFYKLGRKMGLASGNIYKDDPLDLGIL